MPYGNRDRSKQKGLHLPAVTHEMLAQLVVVRGGSESHHANIAIQEYFRTVYTDITQAYGKRYWQKRLEEGHLADKLKLE